MTTTDTITHLLACIDAGERDALHPLADAKPGEGSRILLGDGSAIDSQYGWTTYQTASAAVLDAAQAVIKVGLTK